MSLKMASLPVLWLSQARGKDSEPRAISVNLCLAAAMRFSAGESWKRVSVHSLAVRFRGVAMYIGLGTIETRASFPLGANTPITIAVGDFNGDGKLDVASSNYLPSGSVTVMLGNGDGTFHLGATYPVGVQPFYIASADFRHEGILDLVVGDFSSNNVYVMLGSGDGTFQAAVPYPTSGNPFAVSTGDFNGDGKLDIIVLAEPAAECDCIEVLPGNGDGTFGSAIITPVPYNIDGLAFAVGRFNKGNNLDVAVAGQFGTANQVDILLGNGDGTFTPDGFYPVGSGPQSLAVADFNGDKKADLAVGSYQFGSIGVLLGNGDGTFQQAVNYGTATPTDVIVEDLDGDGKLDLIASNFGGVGLAGVSVLKGNGDGTFQKGKFYPAGDEVSYVAAGDFNGDHKIDLALPDYRADFVITLLNTGVVSFSPTTPIDFPFQLVNTTSVAQTVTLKNTGTTALTISAIKTSGQFSTTSTCGTSVAPGAMCSLKVTFSPKTQGSKSGAISIKDSASTKPQVIELSGAGTVVELSPLSLTFGSQKVGSKSAPQSVKLTNTGTAAIGISQIIDSGTDGGDFLETNNCPSSLNAGANCSITVTFDPRKTGTRTAKISISDSGGGSPQSVPLTGVGD
jgi:hypothetical protein